MAEGINHDELVLEGQHFGELNTRGAAIDLGGTLAKVVMFSVTSKEGRTATLLSMRTFVDRREAIDFVSAESDSDGTLPLSCVMCTGVGSVILQDELRHRFGERLTVDTEEGSLSVKGFCFLFTELKPEQILHKMENGRCIEAIENKFPCMFVILGTMAVVYKIESSRTYERVGGSNRGGRTFTGLGKLLTKAETHKELIDLAKSGTSEHLDLTIGDLTGLKAYEADSAPLRFVASYFGKATENENQSCAVGVDEYKREDLARSLLHCISTDLGHLSVLYGKAFGINDIYMAGGFIGGESLVMETLSAGAQMWSYEWGDMRPRFVKYDGYMTAIGALVKNNETQLND